MSSIFERSNINAHQIKNSKMELPFEIRRTQSSSSAILTKTQTSFRPITSHYNLNKRLYHAFLTIMERRKDKYELALVIGLQFCRVSLFDIPDHGYYDSPKYYKLKLENAMQVVQVTDILCTQVIQRLLQKHQSTDAALSRSDFNSLSVTSPTKSGHEHEPTPTSKRNAKGKSKIKNKPKMTPKSSNNDNFSQLSTDILNKIQEAKLLRQVAKEHMIEVQSIKTTSNATAPPLSPSIASLKNSMKNDMKQQQQQQQQNNHRSSMDLPTKSRRNSFMKKEVVQVEEDDDIPTCLRMLDCGGSGDFINNICSSSKKLDTVNESANDNNGELQRQVQSQSKAPQEKKNVKRILSPMKKKLIQQHYAKNNYNGDNNSIFRYNDAVTMNNRTEMLLRNASAPAELGTPPTPSSSKTSRPKPIVTNLNDDMNADVQRQNYQHIKKATYPDGRNTSVKEYPHLQNHSKGNRGISEEEQYEADLERALYLSGLEFQSSNPNPHVQPNATNHSCTIAKIPPKRKAATQNNGSDNSDTRQLQVEEQDLSSHRDKHLKRNESGNVDVQTISLIYKEDFDEMQRNNLIEVTYVDTYQGRIPGSTNGCTVIAPLLALHHLCDEQELSTRHGILMEGKKLIKYNDFSERSAASTSTGSFTVSTRDSRIRSNSELSSFNPAEDDKCEVSSLSSMEQNMLDDLTIKTVIDIQAPIVLPKVRGGLGLHKDALIVPSDVHEFLIDINMLKQDQFVDVCTGNILHDSHLAKFIETLAGFHTGSGSSSKGKEQEQPRDKKLAATFFFHEHVISILMVTQRTYTNLKDLSSHGKSEKKKSKKGSRKGIFKRFGGKNRKATTTMSISEIHSEIKEESWFEIIDSLPGSVMLGYSNEKQNGAVQSEEVSAGWIPTTARIRCYNMESLHAAMRWYACSKFTQEDQKYINTYQWDPMNVDFDPRVFQAFIWSC